MPTVVSPLVSFDSLFGIKKEMSTDEPIPTAKPSEDEDDDAAMLPPSGNPEDCEPTVGERVKEAASRYEALLRKAGPRGVVLESNQDLAAARRAELVVTGAASRAKFASGATRQFDTWTKKWGGTHEDAIGACEEAAKAHEEAAKAYMAVSKDEFHSAGVRKHAADKVREHEEKQKEFFAVGG